MTSPNKRRDEMAEAYRVNPRALGNQVEEAFKAGYDSRVEELREARVEIERLKALVQSQTDGSHLLTSFTQSGALIEERDAWREQALALKGALAEISRYAKPDDRHAPLAYQSNFLGLSICVKWAKEALAAFAEWEKKAGEK
jgi:hypothetical protein